MNIFAGRKLKIFSYIVLAAFIISLIPLVVIAFFNHPSADDFSFSQLPAHTWEQTHSISQTLQASIDKIEQMYNTWQGSFSAMFLMTLQPGIWGENYYCITTILILASFIFASMLFFYTVLRKWLKLERHFYLIIGLILTAACIQFVPSPVQAFYWYNGSIYYTFFYALDLIAVSLLFLGNFAVKKWSRILCWVISPLLFFIIGGGNYVSALITMIVTLLITVYSFWKKKSLRWISLICMVLCGTAFAISALAPGNAVRQDALGETMSPVSAIIASFVSAFNNFGAWTTSPILILFLFLSPFLYIAASKTSCSFKMPLLWIGLAFCIFAAHFTPTLYTTQAPSAGRITNIIFYFYILFMAFSIFYVSGWIHKKLSHATNKAEDSAEESLNNPAATEKSVLKNTGAPDTDADAAASITGVQALEEKPVFEEKSDIIISSITAVSKKCTVGILIIFILLFGLTVFGQKGFKSLASYSAARSLISGEAAVYKAEQEERLQILNNPDIKNAVLKPFTRKPAVLFFNDITQDPSNWLNQAMAGYYDKDSVALEP